MSGSIAARHYHRRYMMNTIELTLDQTDQIIVTDLKKCIRDLLDDPWMPHHDLEKTKLDIQAFMRVLEYYLRRSEFEDFKKEMKLRSSTVKVKIPVEFNFNFDDL